MVSYYSLIFINHVSIMNHMENVAIIILDASVVLSLDCVIGSPRTYPKSTPMYTGNDGAHGSKRLRCDASKKVKNYSCLCHDKIINSEVPFCHPSNQHPTC
jgi:hypothetical protein